MTRDRLVYSSVLDERTQSHPTRQELYSNLETEAGLPIVSYFTSFIYPVMINDNDADMLEGILQKTDLTKGLVLLLNSPGGDGLAAERIINVCRSYSGTGDYSVIIPAQAKSAATMICLGASKLIMGKTSELGSIDPQVIIGGKSFSVYNIVRSYEMLFEDSVKTEGNLEPYVQQLANYDAREIAEYNSALSLSEDIAIKALKTGMLSNYDEDGIKKKIGIFLTPEEVKDHGRAIHAQEVISCDLNAEMKELKGSFWSLVYELYVRLNNYVSNNNVAKCIESKDHSFFASVRKE